MLLALLACIRKGWSICREYMYPSLHIRSLYQNHSKLFSSPSSYHWRTIIHTLRSSGSGCSEVVRVAHQDIASVLCVAPAEWRMWQHFVDATPKPFNDLQQLRHSGSRNVGSLFSVCVPGTCTCSSASCPLSLLPHGGFSWGHHSPVVKRFALQQRDILRTASSDIAFHWPTTLSCPPATPPDSKYCQMTTATMRLQDQILHPKFSSIKRLLQFCCLKFQTS